jgi:hypothetical protein
MRARKGVSPLISFVLTIMFGVIMVTLVLTVVNPTLDRAKDSGLVTEAFENLPLLDATIKEVASEAQGSKRTVTISLSRGKYVANGTKDFISYEFDPTYAMGLSGTRGSIRIERGLKFFDYFNSYGTTSDVASVWTALSGTWTLDSYKYKGMGGLSYKYIGPVRDYTLFASIANASGTGGEAYIIAVSPTYLVGYWAMDNRTGSKAYDYSGRGNNGTLTNMNTIGNATSGWTTDCKFGSCLKFDGVNDYIDAGSSSVLGPTDFTIATWIKTTAINGGVVERMNTSNYNYQFELSGGGMALKVYDGTNYPEVQGLTLINDGQWHFVVGVRDTSETKLKIYVDGVLDQQATDTTTSSIFASANTYIGIRGDLAAGTYFNGTIDEVKVWSTALTEAQILAEYETSWKKLEGTGGSVDIAAQTDAYIVLVNPDGDSRFDDVYVTDNNDITQTFIIPYTNVDITTTTSFGQGDHRVTVEHMGVNTTTNRPMIQIS